MSNTKRYQVGLMNGETRHSVGAGRVARVHFTQTVVFDRGPEQRHWNAIAGFRGRYASELANDLADDLNGETYIPPVLRG